MTDQEQHDEHEEQEEWIAGKHPVLEALRAGREIN
jgi:23S rRNA (guanosine2251-2'-O)-methyltransferase